MIGGRVTEIILQAPNLIRNVELFGKQDVRKFYKHFVVPEPVLVTWFVPLLAERVFRTTYVMA